MRQTFADSYYFLALFNPDDAAHTEAVIASRNFRGQLVTTDWIVTEVADALCDPANRTGCVALIDDLRRSPSVVIVTALRALFDEGWQLYCDRPDKG